MHSQQQQQLLICGHKFTSLFPPQTSSSGTAATAAAAEYFEELRVAENEVFKWLRDEYRSLLHDDNDDDDDDNRSARVRRDVESGEDWYKNFQCQADNKSCDGQISEQQPPPQQQQQQRRRLLANRLNGEKLQQQRQRHREPANGKIMNELVQQQVMSGHRAYLHHDVADKSSGNDADAINRLLHAKTSMAAQKNDVREIELKHQHLTAPSASSSFLDDETFALNENQLRAETQAAINGPSLNGNFHSPDLDSSLEGAAAFIREKRSSGQKQQQQRYDDQFNLARNTLFDELRDDNAGNGRQRQQQQDSNEPRNRVKRRDAINQINRHDGLSKSIDYESDGSRLMNYCECTLQVCDL
jgi:hypothetical protein